MTAAAALPASAPLVVRLGGIGDIAYVVNTWMESERRAPGTRGPDFIYAQKRMERDVLREDRTRLLVASPGSDPETILGWLAYSDASPRELHYVYVRAMARRMGIARALVASAELGASPLYAAWPAHVAAGAASPIADRIPSTWIFAPRGERYERKQQP